MSLITELKLRKEFLKNGVPSVYSVLSSDILTPAAIDFLKAREIEIVYLNEKDSLDIKEHFEYSPPINKAYWKTSDSYKNYYTGEIMTVKPESMTHLFNDVLVYKDDPRIILRGRLDTLQAHIIETQVRFHEKKRNDLISQLDELLSFTREILKSEVLNEPLEEKKVLGMDSEEIRDLSHNTKKYFNIKQMVLVNYKLGLVVSKLNFLRTYSRECELSAVIAYREGDKINQETIIKSLNRLSSCFHILMYKELANM